MSEDEFAETIPLRVESGTNNAPDTRTRKGFKEHKKEEKESDDDSDDDPGSQQSPQAQPSIPLRAATAWHIIRPGEGSPPATALPRPAPRAPMPHPQKVKRSAPPTTPPRTRAQAAKENRKRGLTLDARTRDPRADPGLDSKPQVKLTPMPADMINYYRHYHNPGRGKAWGNTPERPVRGEVHSTPVGGFLPGEWHTPTEIPPIRPHTRNTPTPKVPPPTPTATGPRLAPPGHVTPCQTAQRAQTQPQGATSTSPPQTQPNMPNISVSIENLSEYDVALPGYDTLNKTNSEADNTTLPASSTSSSSDYQEPSGPDPDYVPDPEDGASDKDL